LATTGIAHFLELNQNSRAARYQSYTCRRRRDTDTGAGQHQPATSQSTVALLLQRCQGITDRPAGHAAELKRRLVNSV
jgi:hypothetical protein